MRPIGVHTSIKNSLINSINEAVELKCNTFQIFLHSPQVWQIPEFEQEIIDEFKSLRELHALNPLIVHASYLINLISSNPKTIASSRYLLKREVLMADLLGADYYVIHLKDNKDMDKNEIFAKTREGFSKIGKLEKCKILIENTAKSKITSKIPDLIETFNNINNENLGGICIDTCHLFAAGYDISSDDGISKFIEESNKYGFDLIKLIHLNDSKTSAGSEIDRHEHIGKGHIGIKGFENFLNIKELSNVPLILETPKKSLQDDLKNLSTVREILKKLES
ncbi:Endonuclease IV [Thermodesulfovibrio sp. N1]|uniref:deoxyribonuclease IV n=1 Tax=unclassified Thermodesulfovibrio TaxID=2645936 RepID=UPI00083B7477|nr:MULTISPECIES: deoxyribonuclease IV [unclassified Thermodesulfovibrio]MDI1472593.1 deoxyribonuclease IV [Thermodesulfovibrio sp. 1176]ODA44402.1 Endonuclease IV [Thermodesulfovibrio sp. N1]